MTSRKIVVVGGSAAGPKAASRAKRMDQSADVVLIQREPELSMSSCGYPYYVGGTFDKREQLLSTPVGVVRDVGFFAGAKGVTARVETEVATIDRAAKSVVVRDLRSGAEETLAYDKLILCVGASAKSPPIPGRELSGVTTLHELADADGLKKVAATLKGKSAVVVGAGLIGVETCEALTEVGARVTVVECLPQVLSFLDPEIAKPVENHIRSKGVEVILNTSVTAFLGENGGLTGVRLSDGRELPCAVAVIAVGVTPNNALARDCGLVVGETGGIVVDDRMRTSDPDIYAAGDCVETVSRITGERTLAPYGDLANLEARVAADNAVLGDATVFPGTIHSGMCKVFAFTAAATGLTESKARARGLDVVTAVNASPDKPGFMGAKLLISKITADARTGRVLGYQCVGPGDVNRQASEASMAVLAGMTLDDVAVADLPYAPPYCLAIDHFIASAHIAQNKVRGYMRGMTSYELKAKLDRGERPFILDVRSPAEHAEMRLGAGEVLIPLGQLRKRMGELPADKSAEIVVFCRVSMRGYEAQIVLNAAGWTNVTVLEGGLLAWPFPREA